MKFFGFSLATAISTMMPDLVGSMLCVARHTPTQTQRKIRASLRMHFPVFHRNFALASTFLRGLFPSFFFRMPAATLLLPASDNSWRVWKPCAKSSSEVVDTPANAEHLANSLLIGLPAAACRTIGLLVPKANDDVMEQLVVTHLERRGLKLNQDKKGKNYRWHSLGQTGGQAILSVDVLAEPFPEKLAATNAQDYTAALRLTELPPDQIVILEEQGDLVLAASHRGNLYHSHIFAQAPASDELLALEITLAKLAIETDLGEGCINSISIVSDALDPALARHLTHSLGMPVTHVTSLAPKAELDTHGWTKLLPAAVRTAQSAAAARSKLIRWTLLGCGLIVSLLFLAYAYLVSLERHAADIEQQVELIREPAEAVRETAERWKSYAPAVDSQRYPMFLLAEVTRLMPATGIVIRKFEVKGGEIEIRGEARDAQLAFQFIEDFKKNKVLSRYIWTNPRPEVKGTTATFRAQGKLP